MDKVFQNMLEERLSDLHTCMLCEVLSFDESIRTAKIKPIPKRKYKDGRVEDYSVISNVPTLKRKIKPSTTISVDSPYYQSGDIVLVLFSERALDGAGNRKHDITDAVILGVI